MWADYTSSGTLNFTRVFLRRIEVSQDRLVVQVDWLDPASSLENLPRIGSIGQRPHQRPDRPIEHDRVPTLAVVKRGHHRRLGLAPALEQGRNHLAAQLRLIAQRYERGQGIAGQNI